MPGIALDPGVIGGIRERAPAPLLLLPLRLEYRVLERRTPPTVALRLDLKGAIADVVREKATAGPTATARRATGSGTAAAVVGGRAALEAAARGAELRAARSKILQSPLKSERATLKTATEIWFRWYPDEGFAEKGVPVPTADEQDAVDRFGAATGSKPWYDASDGDVSAAWQTLARDVGPARAVHLLRRRGQAMEGTEDRFGRIAALPRRVALLALGGNGGLTLLGEGAEIPAAAGAAAVAYTPASLEPGGWLSDFGQAVDLGMGLKLTVADKVTAALAADWVIAVGIHSGNGVAEIEALLADAVANGSFGFLPQDSATNNSAGSPSAHTAARTDPLGFLRTATQHERGEVTAEPESAAANLAEALGIDGAVVRGAVHAADGAFEDARAMLRVVGPVLLDAALDGATALEGVDENALIDSLAVAAVSARGPLPTLRLGNNPYGLLPATRLDDLAVTPDADDTPGKVHNFLLTYTRFLRDWLAQRADAAVPVLQPDDPEAAEKLERILEQYPVSRRLEVGDVGSDAPIALGCPYVGSASRPAAGYLKDLRTKALSDLPDPDESDLSWPLLYRLARLSLEANTVLRLVRGARLGVGRTEAPMKLRGLASLSTGDRAKLPGAELKGFSVAGMSGMRRGPASIKPAVFRAIQLAATNFAAALKRLEDIAGQPDGVARLETLLMETVDLFQHRVDALATGIAYKQLLEQRRLGATGLSTGYYGFLSKLRPESATGSGDGYIQAPSLPQATTAAVLRSAYRRHRGDGAFAIDLPSRRVRRGLAMLGMQRQGLSMSEVLGLRGERWLHDAKKDVLILRLREKFPLKNETPPEASDGAAPAAQPVRVRLFDGLAFVEGALTGFTAVERPVVTRLKAVLLDDLDAVSDLVMCEAVHQRSLGQAEAANAWLQVLAGEPVPGEPSFLRTQRHGQGSSHRVSFLIPTAAMDAGAVSPREIAEPALAAFAADRLGDLSGASVRVTFTRLADAATASVDLGITTDLGLRPLDLVVGGESELRVRLRQHAVRAWQTDPGLVSALGPLPATGLQGYVSRAVSLTFDLAAGGVDLQDVLARAAELRALVQRGRPLEPTDLGAAASPDHPLEEAVEVQILAAAAAELRLRASTLRTRIETDRSTFAAAHGTFIARAREARRATDAVEPEAAVRQALLQAELARRALVTRLIAVAGYGRPEALRAFSTEEVVAEPDLFDEAHAALEAKLVTARQTLDAAIQIAGTPVSSRMAARGVVRGLVAALRSALDGDALPVLPPIARRAETTPLLGAAQRPADVLGPWAEVRESVALPLAFAARHPSVSAFPVLDAATADEPDPDDDPRAEEEAPRTHHFGVLLGPVPAVTAPQRYVGVVCDEWVEQRPSRTQMAGLAVNYDSPQGQPPHCLLLCVAPKPGVLAWTETAAAGIVAETIQWMKIRSLATDDQVAPASLFPTANQVPYTGDGKGRVPGERYRLSILPGLFGARGFHAIADASRAAVGVERTGIREILSRHGRKE